MRAGVIGIGDMGSGLALNLIKSGFTTGLDMDCSHSVQDGHQKEQRAHYWFSDPV